MPEFATSPIGQWVVISITFVAVPAWLNCRFSWASKCCSLLRN